MALQDQGLAIGFGQGVDTKTDSKAVVPGKLLRLENAIFTEAHQIAKRLGYDSLTTTTFSPYTSTTGVLVSPKMVKVFNGELICADSGRLYSYSPTLAAWVDKGPYESVIPTQQLISTQGSGLSQSYQTQALLNNYQLFAWQETNQTTAAQNVFICVVDTTTGTKILPDTSIGVGEHPICVVLGGSVLAVAFGDPSAASHINLIVLTISGHTVTIGAPVSLATDMAANPSYTSYDVAATSVGGVLSYSTSTTLKTKTFDTTGTVTHTATITTACETISLCTDANNAWVYFWDGAQSGNIYYAVYSISALGVVLAKTIIAGLIAGKYCQSTGAVSNSLTQQTMIYSQSPGHFGSTTTDLVKTKAATTTTSGSVGSVGFTTLGPFPVAKPILVNSTHYLLMLMPSSLSTPVFSTLGLFNMDALVSVSGSTKGYLASRALDGVGNIVSNGTGAYATGFLQTLSALSSTKIVAAAGYLSASEGSTAVYSTTAITFDYSSPDAYQALSVNNQCALNGGVVHLYDGTVCAELNFNTLPDISFATTNGVGNVTFLPTYIAIYQWTDQNNNLHQSGISNIAVANNTGGAAPWTIQISVVPPLISTKDPLDNSAVIVALYRNNSVSGTNYYLVDTADVLPGTASITFNDSTADLSGAAPLYINGNVLINTPPPPCGVFNLHNNRLWCLDSTNPAVVQYSKTSQLQVGVSFAGDTLSVTCDAKGGPIGALAEMDDKEVIFKQKDRIAILFGDGANDTGTGSTLSTPQFIQTDVGCSVSKSVISQPNGLLFKSPKGWYHMDRSTSVNYIGAVVQQYNGQDVTSAVRLESQTLCVFLTSSGLSLAYDYFFNQWSTFTNHTGVGADVFQDKYTYVRTDGTIFQQNPTSYLDNATTFLVKAQTSWLRLDKIQGFQRIRKVLALGDHLSPASGHGLQISAAYDFESSFSTPVQYTFTDTGDIFQYREALPRQKCDTVSLLIEEVSASAGQTGEYIDLTDLGFEAAVKKGPNKLPAAQSAG